MESAIHAVLETAVWAPSGDNSQPWSFTLRGPTVRIHLDPHRDNPILNYKLSGTYIAHGALIENIALTAPLHGLRAQIVEMPDPSDSLCTASITFAQSTEPIDPLSEQISKRHTNRKPYTSQLVEKSIQDALARAAQMPGTKLYLTEDRAAIRDIADASAYMEQVALETPELRALFVKEILWREDDNRSGRQGLFIKTMELPQPAQLLLRYINKPSVLQFAQLIRFAKLAKFTDRKLYAATPLMALITTQGETPGAYITAGRAMQRLWLEATKHGIAAQPVTGILFLARSVAAGLSLPVAHSASLQSERAKETIRKRFNASEGHVPLLVLRLGFANAPTARSFRRTPVILTETV